MILSAQTIRKLNIITPFCERSKHLQTNTSYGLSAAGYDIRIDQDLAIFRGDFILASSMEKFEMPNNVLGKVADKSSWARRGLSVQNTIIEPGWCGYLTLEINNNSKNPYFLKQGTPIAQIIFEFLDEPTEQPYGKEDKYQNQSQGPQKAL